MEVEEVLKAIKGNEEEHRRLLQEYFSLVKPCVNRECHFNRVDDNSQNSCMWTNLITECRDYKERES